MDDRVGQVVESAPTVPPFRMPLLTMPAGGGVDASGLDTAIEATNPPITAATVPSTDVGKDGNKFAPGGQSGPKHRMPGGGLAGAVKSVQDKLNASISKVTDGLKGGHTTNSGDTN